MVEDRKEESGVPSLTVDEAVDFGLCYGCFLGQRKSYNSTYDLQKYVRPRSRWSQVNVARVEELIAARRMRPSGLVEVEAAKADRRWARQLSLNGHAHPVIGLGALSAIRTSQRHRPNPRPRGMGWRDHSNQMR